MTEKRFIPDSAHMEVLIHSIKSNCERESKGYAKMRFTEQIDKVREGMPNEVVDEFMQIAHQYGYKPIGHHVKTMDSQ